MTNSINAAAKPITSGLGTRKNQGLKTRNTNSVKKIPN